MRELNIGTKKYTTVVCDDMPSHGGACHVYRIIADGKTVASISFQLGPIKEHGVNGCHNEDLLAIVIDRLSSFQGGQYKCRENALAITKIEEALHWLRARTMAREAIGVEGTSKLC